MEVFKNSILQNTVWNQKDLYFHLCITCAIYVSLDKFLNLSDLKIPQLEMEEETAPEL